MLISLRRMVALRALPSSVPGRVPVARERVNAILARTSQAAFAVKFPDGRGANAPSQVGIDLLANGMPAVCAEQGGLPVATTAHYNQTRVGQFSVGRRSPIFSRRQ